jgi:peroxiredoxin
VAVSPLLAVEDGVLRVIGPPYPLLADPEHLVAEAFNVYDLLGTGYAAPSVFVIDSNGDIVWSYVGQNRNDRPTATSILEHLP